VAKLPYKKIQEAVTFIKASREEAITLANDIVGGAEVHALYIQKWFIVSPEPVRYMVVPLATTPPAAQPEQWEKPSASFDVWWDSDYDDSANPFTKDSAAYWAWAGWRAAQRPWVGLTDDEIAKVENSCVWNEIYPVDFARDVDFARAIETKLREKNGG